MQLYHNPRCSKSRQTLALLMDKGVHVEVIEYLKTPPTAAELSVILTKLGMSPLALMRQGEDEFKAHVAGKDLDDAALIQIMVTFPKLIERPILIHANKAVIGRPPEAVLVLLDEASPA